MSPINPYSMATSSAIGWYEGRRAQRLERQRIGQQQAFNKEMFEKRYQMTMADMRKAGLNPILAYKQGPGTAPSSGGGSFQPARSTFAEDIARGQTMKLQNKQMEQLDSIINLNQANTAKTMEDRSLIMAKREHQNIENAFASGDLLGLPAGTSRLMYQQNILNQVGKDLLGWLKETFGMNSNKRVSILNNSFDPLSPLWNLPKNLQKKIKQDKLWKQLNSANTLQHYWDAIVRLKNKFQKGSNYKPLRTKPFRPLSPHGMRK